LLHESWIVELAGDGARRAFINYAFDFSGVGPVNIYPWASGRLENTG